MHQLGVLIYLHCFEFGRGRPKELEEFCKEVYYYPRNSTTKSLFSTIPFRIKSRSNKTLVTNLKKIKAPILFEGLHTTYPLLREKFDSRKILVRAHNIEHFYHVGLAKSERKLHKKLFFRSEGLKLVSYESILHKATTILAISPAEYNYFKGKFGEKTNYIPAFHDSTTVKKLSGKGDYSLYHGDLRVSDNIKSVEFLIAIFKKTDHELVIASSFKNKVILKEIQQYKNIKFVEIKDLLHLKKLLSGAHINVLPTFQKTGIKLKLINALFNSRFCIATNKMVEDTGLEDLCVICNSKKEFLDKITELSQVEYNDVEVVRRTKILAPFNTKENAKKIIALL